MAIMDKGLKSLLPPNWKITGDLKLLIEALAVNLERIRVFLRGVIAESEPGTAVEFLSEWFDQLGIKYDATQTLATRQAKANQVYSSTGGQDPDYLQTQIQKSYPDVYIEHAKPSPELMVGFGMVGLMMVTDYPSWYPSPIPGADDPIFYYRVYGEVDQVTDLLGVQNILSRIMPVPYEPVFSVVARSTTPRGDVGIGMVGLMMVGRSS